MSLRNKLAILSFTLMSLMTIPTFAENDTPSVTSRIEDAIHTVEIKTPAGWQETKAYSEIPESFEFNGLTFHGLKFKNGTERHGCAIFFATDLDEDNDEISEEVLVQAHAQVQQMAFPGMHLSQVTFTKFQVNGSIEGNIEKDYAKVNLYGSLEGNLSNASGNPSTVKVSGRLEGDTNNFAAATGRITLEGSQSYYGATGVLLADDYQLIIVAWGADEGILEKDLNSFKDSIAITPKIPTKKPATEPAVVKEQTTDSNVPVAKVEEPKQIEAPVAVIEETKAAAPAEPVATLEEPKQAEIPIAVTEEAKVVALAEPVATLEEPKQAEIPIAVTEEAKVVALAEPVATLEEPKQAETPIAVTEEAKAIAPAEPVATLEEPKQAETPIAVIEEAKVAAPVEPVVTPEELKQAETFVAVTKEDGQGSVLAPPVAVIEQAKEADTPAEVAQAVVETAQVHPNV